MKPASLFRLAAFAALAAGVGAARAQDPATLAVSREATMYVPPGGSTSTLAVSRETTMYVSPGANTATLAVSREATMYVPPGGDTATLAVSREATMYVPPGALAATLATSREVTLYYNYSIYDAALALRLAAGLQPASTLDSRAFGLLNINTSGASASVIDVLDAAAIAQAAAHPELAP